MEPITKKIISKGTVRYIIGEPKNENKQIAVCPRCGAKIHCGGTVVTTLLHIQWVIASQRLRLNVIDFDVVTENVIT